jgi:hypothetical protein
MRRRRHLAIAAAVAVGLVAATARAASVPTNLCALDVSTQLRALPVSPTCSVGATRSQKGVAVRTVKWGSRAPHASIIEAFVVTGLSESAFVHSVLGRLIVPLGQPLAFPDAVVVDDWSNGVGVEVSLILKPPTPANLTPAGLKLGQRYAPQTVAFAKALTSHA